MGRERDEQLEKAAIYGDVEFLKQAFAKEPPEYFLAQSYAGSSIFHIAVQYGNVEFMKEAMNILPTNILKQLLLITDENSYTPLHRAALRGHFLVTKCIREICESLSWDDDEDHVKPWLALTEDNETPLNLALCQYRVHEKCVMEIMLMDSELESCTIPDKDGNTPLYYAVNKGYITKNSMNLVAEKILKSPLPTASIVGSRDPLSLLRWR